MKQSAFFRRTLVLVYGTVLLFAVLIMAIYTVISPNLFARNKIDELIPKGQIIADYIESTLRGEISTTYLVPLIGRSTSQWEATVWVVDTQGSTLIRTQQADGRRVGRLPASLSKPMLERVLAGEIATHIGSLGELGAADSGGAGKSSGVLSDLASGLNDSASASTPPAPPATSACPAASSPSPCPSRFGARSWARCSWRSR